MDLTRRLKTALRALIGNAVLDPSSPVSVDAFLRAGAGWNDNRAKNCSTVFSCVRLLSDAVASLPLKLYRLDADTRTPARENPLYRVLSTAPCPAMDKFVYWKFNMNCLLLRGFFVSHVIRSANGKTIRLLPVNPVNVDVDGIELSPFGELMFPITNPDTGVRRVYPAGDLFFAYYETIDGVRPVSPLAFARQTIALARDAERYGMDTLRKRAIPSGYYSTPDKLSREVVENVSDQLDRQMSGDGAGRPPLLSGGLQFHAVTMSAADMQMLEMRRYQKEEICGIFGVPPHMIGDTAQAKGWSTMEQQMTEFVQLSLTPYLVRIENAITTRILPDRTDEFARFSVDGLLRGDTTARTNLYQRLFSVGALSANEIRAREELNPIPEGDKYYVPLNLGDTGNGEEN